MIITPPILPPSFNVPAQVQTMPLIPDAELKARLKYTALCYEYKNSTILRIKADALRLQNYWTYINPITCERKTAAIKVTHAEYSNGAYDAQDILEKYVPVESFNHSFNKTNNLPTVLPVPLPPVYSDFPGIYLASN